MCKGFLKNSISNNIIAQYRFQMCKGFLKNSISDNIIAQYGFQMCKGFLKNSISITLLLSLPAPESKCKKPPGTGIKNI